MKRLISSLRFLTSASVAGGERLIVSTPVAGMCSKKVGFTAEEISGQQFNRDTIPPMSIMFVKGWTRSFCALTLMAACKDRPDLFEAVAYFELIFFFFNHVSLKLPNV